jgi:hypothetical protein
MKQEGDIRMRYVEVKGVRYLRGEDVVRTLRDLGEPDVYERLRELTTRIEEKLKGDV